MGNQLARCFSGDRRRHVAAAVTSEPYDDDELGHSFCYSSKIHRSFEDPTAAIFRSISGAAVSANAVTPLSTSLLSDLAAAFESSASFSAAPLFTSGPLDRRFASGPLDRRPVSGPLDRLFSGPLRRSISRRAAGSILRRLKRTISGRNRPEPAEGSSTSDPSDSPESGDLHWAQGRAGEDRVHVVISEEHRWVFVGIYDGFNGPDATDFLLSNLYSNLRTELKGLLWEDPHDSADTHESKADAFDEKNNGGSVKRKRRFRGAAKRWEEKQRRWKCEWVRERLDLDRRLKQQPIKSSSMAAAKHDEVLKVLCEALRKTEDAYLGIADKMVGENPELALMGSCVLVMLMRGEDVYLMNVGDSRAVLAQKAELDAWGSIGNARLDLERINEAWNESEDRIDGLSSLDTVQLTLDHSTGVEEEVFRIRNEHPDDSSAIANDRVKGSLKVTRAFGAGFLKQPKWNEALLEMFRIDYVGTSPYITCSPTLYHHKLGPKDRFLVLSSDGLYQYFTNEEAVAQVDSFIATTPEGDPAQHLVEEVLFRAAEKAGMDFYELLEIPQGDRRRYHDDVSIIVISFEGRIWKSCV